MEFIQIIDQNFPADPQNTKDIYNTLKGAEIIVPASQIGADSNMGDVVNVRIFVDPGTNFYLIQPYMGKEIFRSTGEYGTDWEIDGYVPLNELENIAEIKEVRQIMPLILLEKNNPSFLK
jgi:hypothetical protein